MKDVAKNPLQCFNSTLTAFVPTDLEPNGAPTSYAWSPLVIADIPYDAELMWKIESQEKPKPFEHWIDGVKQDGVFLGGYENSTTWGFKWYPTSQGSSGTPYYGMRLLGPNSGIPWTGEALLENETVGYLRVNA